MYMDSDTEGHLLKIMCTVETFTLALDFVEALDYCGYCSPSAISYPSF